MDSGMDLVWIQKSLNQYGTYLQHTVRIEWHTPGRPLLRCPSPRFSVLCVMSCGSGRGRRRDRMAPSERTDPGERMSARAPDSDLEKKKKVSHI